MPSTAGSRTVIGKEPNHWLYSASPPTFDLTRPAGPDYPVSQHAFRLQTTTTPVLLAPSKTALVIVDMQNFFLSTYLGRSPDAAGNRAKQQLVQKTIPAARKLGIQVIWLNWGLTDADIDAMPPSTRRAFGFEESLKRAADAQKAPVVVQSHGSEQRHAAELVLADRQDTHTPRTNDLLTENGKPRRVYKGLGSDMGPVEIDDGKTVDAGRLLMRDTWNAGLPPDLDQAYRQGLELGQTADVWIHKNRMSGLWGSSSPCTHFLEQHGITSLLFAGVNTDQCVAGSLQDAFTKGYDCILIDDACGTTSPAFAKHAVEYNCARTWGFVSNSEHLFDSGRAAS